MATITGKTEFARRVQALGLSLPQLAQQVPFALQTLREVSSGKRKLSPQLDWALKQIEEKAKQNAK